ncbi:MAG: hypothetical protein QY307_02390 [Acidimicrobiia bacterium]|nr:MAG: hypothetical protein QY307_02390 [Acidimicrobiia bacterium]
MVVEGPATVVVVVGQFLPTFRLLWFQGPWLVLPFPQLELATTLKSRSLVAAR